MAGSREGAIIKSEANTKGQGRGRDIWWQAFRSVATTAFSAHNTTWAHSRGGRAASQDEWKVQEVRGTAVIFAPCTHDHCADLSGTAAGPHTMGTSQTSSSPHQDLQGEIQAQGFVSFPHKCFSHLLILCSIQLLLFSSFLNLQWYIL